MDFDFTLFKNFLDYGGLGATVIYFIYKDYTITKSILNALTTVSNILNTEIKSSDILKTEITLMQDFYSVKDKELQHRTEQLIQLLKDFKGIKND